MEKSKLSIFKEKLENANTKHLKCIQKFKDKINNLESEKILDTLAWSSIVLDAAIVKITNEFISVITPQLQNNLSNKEEDDLYEHYQSFILTKLYEKSYPLSKSTSVMQNLTDDSETFVYSVIARAMKNNFIAGLSF